MNQPALMTTPNALASRAKRSSRRTWLLVGGVFVAFCLVRWATGASQFTSSGSMQAALVLTMPIAMAGLAGLWSERAGIVNIGLEGMLIAGTVFGALIGVSAGPWAGVLAGMAGGALFGLIHAITTVTFGVDHIVSGVAINILAVGVAGLLSELAWPESNGKQSPGPGQITKITLPWSESLQSLHAKGIPVVSDLAGLVSGATTNLSLLTLVCLLMFPMTYWVLWRTPWGLRLRSAGESPYAAETLGVNVYKMKYLAVIASGALGGLGGAFLITVSSQGYLENQTGGKGYIGLAAMIFGNWTPTGTLLGSLLFGYSTAVNQRSDLSASTAIVVLAALGLAVLLLFELRKLAQRRGEVAVKRSSRRSALAFTVVLIIGSLVSLVAAGVTLLRQGRFLPDIPSESNFFTIAVSILVVLIMALFIGLAYFGIRAVRAIRTYSQTSSNLPAYVAGYVLFTWMWLSGTGIPQSFKSAIPNIITLLVLAFASQRLRMPAADGQPYRRGK